jgi:hypothetical protein
MGTVNEQECFSFFFIASFDETVVSSKLAYHDENKKFCLKDRLHFNQICVDIYVYRIN